MEYLEELRFLGIKLVNLEDFLDLVLRLLLNTLVVYWISKKIYLKNNHSTSFHFGYTTIALVTFLLCFLLSSIKLDLGFALGLFAIFTIIRFRTGTIPIKEMTYLFVVIGVAVINALANKKVSYAELLVANGVVILFVWYLEGLSAKQTPPKKETVGITLQDFDKTVSLSQEAMAEKIEGLIGREITHFKIKKINQVENYAELTAYIKPLEHELQDV